MGCQERYIFDPVGANFNVAGRTHAGPNKNSLRLMSLEFPVLPKVDEMKLMGRVL